MEKKMTTRSSRTESIPHGLVYNSGTGEYILHVQSQNVVAQVAQL